MEITLKQAYDIFIADRETSCADETISYYKENLTNFFKYCSGYIRFFICVKPRM